MAAFDPGPTLWLLDLTWVPHTWSTAVKWTGETAEAPLDRQVILPDRDRMIRVSAAQYFWFSYPTNMAEQGTRAI